jgi:hypothetical protein
MRPKLVLIDLTALAHWKACRRNGTSSFVRLSHAISQNGLRYGPLGFHSNIAWLEQLSRVNICAFSAAKPLVDVDIACGAPFDLGRSQPTVLRTHVLMRPVKLVVSGSLGSSRHLDTCIMFFPQHRCPSPMSCSNNVCTTIRFVLSSLHSHGSLQI